MKTIVVGIISLFILLIVNFTKGSFLISVKIMTSKGIILNIKLKKQNASPIKIIFIENSIICGLEELLDSFKISTLAINKITRM